MSRQVLDVGHIRHAAFPQEAWTKSDGLWGRRFGTGVIVGCVAGLLIASGWAVADGRATTLVVATALVGLGVLACTRRGAFIGVLVVSAMNGLPFINTSRIIVSKYTLQDAAVSGLLVVVAIWILLDNRAYRPNRLGQAISRTAVLLLLWWLFTLARSVIGQHVPVLHAAAFGRDFLYFALLLILLPRARLTSRDIGMLLVVLLTAVCLFAVGQIMTGLGIGQPGGLIHFQKTLQQSGVTRVYANMTDLVDAGLAASVAAVLLARKRSVRLVALPIALLLTISVAVQLTRARWIGLIVGFLFVGLWITLHGEEAISAVLRRRLTILVSIAGIAGILALIALPDILSSGTLIQRVLSIFSNLENNSGTVAVREAATRTTTDYLGGKWPIGLGLVPPSSHYFAGLPEGSIRDTDLGVLNAVTTIGLVGATLIYLPVVLTLISCLRRRPSLRLAGPYHWLRFGGAIWITAALISSVTLVTLFSTSGLALTAIFLTVLAHPSVSGTVAPSTTSSLRREPAPFSNENKSLDRVYAAT